MKNGGLKMIEGKDEDNLCECKNSKFYDMNFAILNVRLNYTLHSIYERKNKFDNS